MSGVTARALRHYDAIGLLSPAWLGANGYRYYEQEQLLRLQQILLLRELGLDLTAIARVVDGEHDEVETLRHHHRRLLAERDRLDRLVHTVATTITHLEGGTDMPTEEMFEGFRFNPEVIADLEAKAIERTGQPDQPEFAEIKRRTADWDAEDFREVERQGADIERRMLALLRDGVPVDDPAVFAVLDDDVAAQQKFVFLDGAGYAALGEAFTAAPELRAHLDAQDHGLAEYMRDAMVAYAAARMD